jgi:hypothetical protein
LPILSDNIIKIRKLKSSGGILVSLLPMTFCEAPAQALTDIPFIGVTSNGKNAVSSGEFTVSTEVKK